MFSYPHNQIHKTKIFSQNDTRQRYILNTSIITYELFNLTNCLTNDYATTQNPISSKSPLYHFIFVQFHVIYSNVLLHFYWIFGRA